MTTCGAAGALGAFGGVVGFFGVCASTQIERAKTNSVTRWMDLKFIVLLLLKHSLLQDSQDFSGFTKHASARADSRFARFVVNQN